MPLRRLAAALIALCLLLAACKPAVPLGQVSVTITFMTPGPLSRIVQYWDLGLSITYPDNWTAPQFIAGQVLLAASPAAAGNQPPTQPVIAIRIVDPVNQLGLSKTATLDQIALMVGGGQNTTIDTQGTASVAGLDAAYVGLVENNANLYGQVYAFRMPDGRVGAIIGLAPLGIWANFLPTLDQVRAGITLLRPADFGALDVSSEVSRLLPGGITFNYPKGWIDQEQGSSARLYRSSAASGYVDDSGFVNGPQLMVRAVPLAKDATLRTSLIQMISSPSSERGAAVTVGGQPGFQIAFTEPASGQSVTFVAVASQDKTAMIVFRWTTPGLLADAVRPAFDTILQSVKFGPGLGPLVAPATDTAAAPATARP
jgi:hypothetical protein